MITQLYEMSRPVDSVGTRHQTARSASFSPSADRSASDDPGGLRVVAPETRVSSDDVVAFVAEYLADLTNVMVDAPLVVPNAKGMRECDRETHRCFGRFEAGAYPANRTNMGRYNCGIPRGEVLARRLEGLGFPDAPSTMSLPAVAGKSVFECYPHPAQVVLFGLTRTLRYKKKRQGWPAARREFRRYLDFVRRLDAPRVLLPRELLGELDPEGSVGRACKKKKDRLDAFFCAYLSALVPQGRVEMIGTANQGGIVVPT